MEVKIIGSLELLELLSFMDEESIRIAMFRALNKYGNYYNYEYNVFVNNINYGKLIIINNNWYFFKKGW